MIKKILIIFILIYFFTMPKIYGINEIISSQMETLNISTLVKEGQAYTKKSLPDIDIKELLNSAIKGKIDNKNILNGILSLFIKELTNTFSLMASILVVIVINSILKSFSDNLDNKGVAQIAYYAQYILIVTLVMVNFSTVIALIKETISNLVGFATSLIPILLALIAASRKYCFNYIYRTCNSFFCCFYCQRNNFVCFTPCIYCNSTFNCI